MLTTTLTAALLLTTAPTLNPGFFLDWKDLTFITPLERGFQLTDDHSPWLVVAVLPKTLRRQRGSASFEAIWMLPAASDADAIFVVVDCEQSKLAVQATGHLESFLGGLLLPSELSPASAGDAEMTPITETPWGFAAESFACGT